MLLVLFSVCLIGLILSVIWLIKSKRVKEHPYYQSSVEYNDSAIGMTIVSGLLLFFATVGLIAITIFSVKSKYIPAQIEVIRKENTQMETDINSAIEKYCEHENKTFIELKPNEIQFALVIYPELKADELVTSYIETMKENRNEIKKLELEYTQAGIYRWWLYFGD